MRKCSDYVANFHIFNCAFAFQRRAPGGDRALEQTIYYRSVYDHPMHWGSRSPINSSALSGGRMCPPFWRRLLAIAGLISVAFLPSEARAERVSVAGRAEAVIVTRLSLLKTDDLNFGKIVAGTTAGTVIVTPLGTRTATGGVRLAGTGAQPAAFAGYGFANQIVAISVTSNTPVVRRIGGTEFMQFDTFIIGSTPTAQLTTAPLAFRIASTTGMFAFPVGATLRVSARQAPGVYSGSFSVTLNYQ